MSKASSIFCRLLPVADFLPQHFHQTFYEVFSNSFGRISVFQNPLKGEEKIVTKKVSQKSILGDALGLKYEPLTCLNFFRSSLKKF
jgi:hypothetical protein